MQDRPYQNAMIGEEVGATAFYRWNGTTDFQDMFSSGKLVPKGDKTVVSLGRHQYGEDRCSVGGDGMQLAVPLAVDNSQAVIVRLGLEFAGPAGATEYRVLAVFAADNGPHAVVTARRTGSSLVLTMHRWWGTYWNTGGQVLIDGAADRIIEFYALVSEAAGGFCVEGQAMVDFGLGSNTGKAIGLVELGSYGFTGAAFPAIPSPVPAGMAGVLVVESMAHIPAAFVVRGTKLQGLPYGRREELFPVLKMGMFGYRETEDAILSPLDVSGAVLTVAIAVDEVSFVSVDAIASFRVPGAKEFTYATLSAPSGLGPRETVGVLGVDVETGTLQLYRGLRGTVAQSWPIGTVIRGLLTRANIDVRHLSGEKMPSSTPVVEPAPVVTLQLGGLSAVQGETYQMPNPSPANFAVTACGFLVEAPLASTASISFGFGAGNPAGLSSATVYTSTHDWELTNKTAALVPDPLALMGGGSLSVTVGAVSNPGDFIIYPWFQGFAIA